MGKLDDAFRYYLASHMVARGDLEVDEPVFYDWSGDILKEFIDAAAPGILIHIKRDTRVELKRQRRKRQSFEERLWIHWRKPLHLLNVMVDVAQEIGQKAANEFTEESGSLDNPTHRALSAIHARACQIARAILVLLRAGFADDAHARWRSLHELAVVAAFIARDKDGDVAERYLLHETVHQRKLACQYKKYQARAGLDPIAQDDIDELNRRFESLIERFGKPFSQDYGWAAHKLDNSNPSMVCIEKHVAMDHIRPYYRMASDNVHPNAHGALFKLGSDKSGGKSLLAGPSKLGLADPGDGAAMSLMQVTGSLVTVKSSVTLLVWMAVLKRLREETGDAFITAQEATKRITDDQRSATSEFAG